MRPSLKLDVAISAAIAKFGRNNSVALIVMSSASMKALMLDLSEDGCSNASSLSPKIPHSYRGIEILEERTGARDYLLALDGQEYNI